jgi:hypothetical protein
VINLLIAMMSIILTSGLLLVTVNYLPRWATTVPEQAGLVRAGFDKLELAHYLASKSSGVEPSPTADADGGLVALFQPYYSFLPRAPAGFAWKYGHSAVNGLNWFCLYSNAPADRGVWLALREAMNYYSTERYFVHAGGSAQCGSTTNMAEPASFPAQFSATFYVRYVPGS